MLKKIIAFFVAVTAVGATVLIATKPSLKVPFAKVEWESAQERAKEEEKLFFVDFDASYCATCRNMEESTYMDNTLANFIGQNVVALRVDVQDFDGVMWSQKYEVEALPTMLVFDAKGNLRHKLVGFQSASTLLKIMRETQAPEPAPAPTPAPVPVVADIPQPNNNTNTTNPKGNNSPSLFGGSAPIKPSSSIASSPLGLFEIVVSRAERKGYSLQVGSYANYDAALDQADMMRELYNEKTILCVDKNTASISYKLFVGTFATRDEAMKFQKKLDKNKMGSMIRDLSAI
jgi:thioredoxin-related protein